MEYKFDEQEKLLLKELVKNPRISDNQIAINTKIPVKTINRKRKKLENKDILRYATYINYGEDGTNKFGACRFYIITFKYGISKTMFDQRLSEFGTNNIEIKHINSIFTGEINGRFALIMLLKSRVENDIIEIFNIDIVSKLKTVFGEDAIHNTNVIPINDFIKIHHNYFYKKNIKDGIIKKSWPESHIYV